MKETKLKKTETRQAAGGQIGEIPEGRDSYRLIDIVEIFGGGTPRTSNPSYWGGDIPWISVVDFNNGSRWIYDTEKKITQKGLEESSSQILKKGQLIISARGTVGELGQLGRDMAFNQSCYGLSGTEKIKNDFLYYILKHKISDIKSKTHGSVFDTITRQTFEQIEVSIPGVKTQKAIAKILGDLDEKIEINNRMNKTLEAMGQALFKRWFIDFEFPNEKGKPYKSSGGKMVDSELGKIPEGWGYKTAAEISAISIGRTPPRKEAHWFTESSQDVRWVSIKDMGNSGVFLQKTNEYLTMSAIKKFNIPVVSDNTVLLSFKLTIGRTAITDGEMVTNEAIANFHLPQESDLSAEYLYFYLKNFDYSSLGSTSSIASAVNSSLIKEMRVLVPAEKLHKQFYSLATNIFSLVKSSQRENLALEAMRNSLLPKFMSGEIQVPQ